MAKFVKACKNAPNGFWREKNINSYIPLLGMQVIEWNGIPLTGIAHDEVSRIIANQIGDEIEVVIRTDINLLQGYTDYPGMAQPGSYGYQAGYGYEAGYYPQPQPPQQHYPGMGPGHHGAKMHPGGVPIPPPPPPPGGPQPQVILQHNHPVDEGLMVYDQYGKLVPSGMPPPPPPLGAHPPHPMMPPPHQHSMQPPPTQPLPPAMATGPAPLHHHNSIDAPYYSH